MGTARVPAALPPFPFKLGDLKLEVTELQASISIEESQAPLAQQPTLDESWPKSAATSGMNVRKRNGSLESVEVNKIVRAVGRCATALPNVDVMRVAVKTISGLFDGATTCELDQLSIRTAATLVVEEPEYSRLAARLLETYIAKEVTNQNIHSFSQSMAMGHRLGLIADETAEFVSAHARKLNLAVLGPSNDRFEYFGLRTVYDRYLLRHPKTRTVLETAPYFFLRVACGLAQTPQEAFELFALMEAHEYLPRRCE